jgi:hypothetical protein
MILMLRRWARILRSWSVITAGVAAMLRLVGLLVVKLLVLLFVLGIHPMSLVHSASDLSLGLFEKIHDGGRMFWFVQCNV